VRLKVAVHSEASERGQLVCRPVGKVLAGGPSAHLIATSNRTKPNPPLA
jgi:hypothetical protein